MALIKSSVVGSFEGAQGIILREGTSGAVSVNVYKTKATTATDVDATQIATREIKMTGGYTPNYDNIISFEDGTTFESDDNILIKLSAIDHSSYCGYKSYNPVTVFGKDDSPSAIAIGKAVSASLGLNTEQFNSISTTDLATFLGYLLSLIHI